jgi:hypothetical protein
MNTTGDQYVGIPSENAKVQDLLWQLENGLREAIIRWMDNAVGAKWYKQRLPGDVLEKYQQGLRYDRSVAWVRHVPHHPLYYVDFPDLGKILVRADNWRDVFADKLHNKEAIERTLRDVEPIRNKVAHNRRCAQQDVKLVSASMDKINACIGTPTLSEQARNITALEPIGEALSAAAQELKAAVVAATAVEQLPLLTAASRVHSAWWFDSDYLGVEIEDVAELVKQLRSYSTLPRRRGTGHIIERWVDVSGIADLSTRADAVLARLRELYVNA